MFWRLTLAALTTVAISGCVTTAREAEEAQQQRFQSFIGMTMAQWMAETMVTPHNYYDTSGQRVFVAFKPAPLAGYGCDMQITTRPNGTGTGADAWTIVSIRRQGGCANM
jgi:hypothetical protein